MQHNGRPLSKPISSAQKYIICAIGDMTASDLKLPQSFLYHDPKHMWSCTTWSENNPAIKDHVEKYWSADKLESQRDLAKLILFNLYQDKKPPSQVLHIDEASFDVRIEKSKKGKVLIEVWAHEHNPNSLIDFLEEDKDFMSKIQTMRREMLLECNRIIRRNLKRSDPPPPKCLKLCHCKQSDPQNDHDGAVLNLGDKSEMHIVLDEVPDKKLQGHLENNALQSTVKERLCAGSVEMSKLINNHITEKIKDGLPISFQSPTMQLSLKKLPYPNQLGVSVSDLRLIQRLPQVLFLPHSGEAHFLLAKPNHAPIKEVTAPEAERLVSKLLSKSTPTD